MGAFTRSGRILSCLALLGLWACTKQSAEPAPDTLHLVSPNFRAHGSIPPRYACSNVSPALRWNAPPAKTRRIALVVTDRDSPLQFLFGRFVHWIVYDIPAGTRKLSEGAPRTATFAGGPRQGLNGFDEIGYAGPCPPGGAVHRYVFTLYALDTDVALEPGVKLDQLEGAMRGHVLAEGSTTGHYP
jgi:Raf kinase inhibitor-like YbhB/YbcL family protein